MNEVNTTDLPPTGRFQPLGERANRLRFLIRDLAGEFTDTFDAVLAAPGTTVLKTHREARDLCRSGAGAPARRARMAR